MATIRPTVGVVLVNWNSGEFTIPCIESLIAGTLRPDSILVVDNGSVDGSADAVAARFPEAIIIRNATNLGFAAANNQGIAYLVQQRIDYIWLLNNDTVVAPDCCEQLLIAAVRHPDAAGVSAKIFYEHPATAIWYAGAFRHPWHLGVKHYLDARLDRLAVESAVRTVFISGCCMFVSRGAWIRYGGLEEEYIAYSEDNEWCWRVTEAGGTLYYAPAAHLWHRVSASVRKNTGHGAARDISPRAQYLMCRNQFWTVKRHARGLGMVVAPCMNVAIVTRNAARWMLTGDIGSARACVRGLVDGVRQRVPEGAPVFSDRE